MHCEEALLLISGHLDNENTETEEARLQEHLQGCESCRQILESFRMADSGLLSLTEEAPRDLTHRVMEAIHSETKPQKRKNPWVTVAASAAAVALVVGIGWFALPKPAEDISEDTVAVHYYTAKVVSTQAATFTSATSADGRTLSQEIGAPVVLLDAYVQELDGLGCEFLPDGSRLFTLQTKTAAQELSQAYGGILYLPDSGVSYTGSYALIPAQ